MTRCLFALAFVGLLATTSCDPDSATLKAEACAHICACQSTLTPLRHQCEDSCLAEVTPVEVSIDCLECIVAVSCRDVDDLDPCEFVCDGGGGDDDVDNVFSSLTSLETP